MASVRITGQRVVLANMKARQAQVALQAAAGLKLAGLHLQRVSQSHVPVEYGPLKASAYTRATGSGFSTVVDVGYTASYAMYVHEQVQMKLQGQPRPSGKGKFWDPQGQAYAKFLERPLREQLSEMNRIIAESAKIKP